MTTSATYPSSDSGGFPTLDAMLPDLEKLYTDIHAHPELSMQETRTADIAAERLRDAGYDVATGVGRTGVVGLLRNGDGPVVMLRADMDALPVAEATGLPYASQATATDGEGNSRSPHYNFFRLMNEEASRRSDGRPRPRPAYHV